MDQQQLAGIQSNGQPCDNNRNHDGDTPKKLVKGLIASVKQILR